MQTQVTLLASKGLIQQNTQTPLKYDGRLNNLTKEGKALRIGDLVLRRISPELSVTKEYYTWRVASIEYNRPLEADLIEIGNPYEIFDTTEKRLISHICVGIDTLDKTMKFTTQDGKVLQVQSDYLPSIYTSGTESHQEAISIRMECLTKDHSGRTAFETFKFQEVKSKKFAVDISNTHVIECIGKPHGSKVHLLTTTTEPHGVACLGGLKVSFQMHNFGNRRWRLPLIDDIRSHTDQNTRIIGDFTKNVSVRGISKKMYVLLADKKDKSWQHYFDSVATRAGLSEGLLSGGNISLRLLPLMEQFASRGSQCRRQYLQTRFFETGDQFYLGMEFNREFDNWKKETIDALCPSNNFDEGIQKRFKGTLNHSIDRLWFDAVLEVSNTLYLTLVRIVLSFLVCSLLIFTFIPIHYSHFYY